MDQLISVIIPCYNVEAYLPRCIESVLDQDYKNLEIILIDDESPDNCGIICDHYAQNDSRIIVVHQKNRGLSGARNAGIELAKGDFLFFLDSDDCIYPNTLSKLYELAKENNAELVSAEYFQGENIEDVCDRGDGSIIIGNGAQTLDYVLQNASWSAWGKLYNRALIGDDRFMEGYLYEDFEFVPRQYLKAKKCVHYSHALYFYYIRQSGIMGSSKCKLQPYYVDFAECNLKTVMESCYSNVEKSRVLAGLYKHFMWDASKPMRAYGVKQDRKFIILFSKRLGRHWKDILTNSCLEKMIKIRYVMLFVSPELFQDLFLLSYLVKKKGKAA